MKLSEMREKTAEELTKQIVDWKKDLFNYRLQLSTHKLENTALISKTKALIAQAKTIIKEKEIAIMQISVYLTQKKNICTSAYAVYKKKEQILEMSGNPKVVQDEDTFRAQTITLNLDTQEITMDGRVKGSVTTKDNSKSTSEPTTQNEGI